MLTLTDYLQVRPIRIDDHEFVVAFCNDAGSVGRPIQASEAPLGRFDEDACFLREGIDHAQ
jgi:hypothetical protein